jgi:hypothetical protein
MNVTEEDFRAYIDLFHKTLDATASEFLPEELRQTLLHISVTPALIIGYVSTQFGVAIEYVPASATQIEICRGSARVEDLIVQAPPYIQHTKPIFSIAAADTGFYGCTFSGGFPFRLKQLGASLFLENVTFDAGSWKRTVSYAEVFGNRSRDFWRTDLAVSRAKDEVLAALVESQRAEKKNISIAEYISSFKNKTVLVLGDYDDSGLTRLDQISQVLVSLGYEPLLIKDIPDHPYQDLRQKVVAIGAIARFIVVDDSSKSGHLLEIQLCDQNKWVTILLRAGGHGGSWMTAGFSHLSAVILEQPYNATSLGSEIAEATQWAELKLQELQAKFDSTYPWRHKGS